MSDEKTTLKQAKERIAVFTQERDWQQFHTPKNISMALAAEAAELMELLLWCESQKSFELVQKQLTEVKHEVADVAAYLLIFCNVTGIDLSEALTEKLLINERNYPVKKCKGKSAKYTHYLDDAQT